MYNSYGFLPPPGKMHFTWNRPWRIQVMLLQCNYEMYHVWLWQTQFRSYTSRERGGHVVERKQGRVSKNGRESEQTEKDIKRDEEMPQIKRVKRIESDRVFIQVRLTWKIEWKLQHSFCCCHRMRNIVPAKKKAVVKYDGKAWNWQYHWNSHDCNEHFNPILIFNNIPKITKVNFDSYQKKNNIDGLALCIYCQKPIPTQAFTAKTMLPMLENVDGRKKFTNIKFVLLRSVAARSDFHRFNCKLHETCNYITETWPVSSTIYRANTLCTFNNSKKNVAE